jgi:hypothetical protein
VVATSGTGFVLGSGGAVDLSMLSYTCLGTMMVAASASTLNQVGFSGEYGYMLIHYMFYFLIHGMLFELNSGMI